MQPLAIIDISKALDGRTQAYPGDRRFDLAWTCEVEAGAVANVSEVRGSSHLGTHVDLPGHVFKGAREPSLDSFLGPAIVVERPLGRVAEGLRVLVKGPAPLSIEESRALVMSGARLVGIEGMSVDEMDSLDLPNHRILLGAGVPLLENLDLSYVEPGEYELIALPLKIPGAEASWVRAVLRTA
jgi:arylformamidase